MPDTPTTTNATGGEKSPRRFAFRLRPRPWMFTVGILAVTAVILRAEGRLWTCACGSWKVWAGDIWSSHCSQHLFDPYAFTHVSHGFILWFALACIPRLPDHGWRLRLVVALEAAWEIFENSPLVINRYRMATISYDYLGDTVINALGDVIACLLGALIARRIGLWWTLALFVALEAVLAVAIRDNLILNVVMLLWPFDAVKQWQLSGH
ncbi:MAG: hypothetical protein RL689_1276 [Planctomycetota bacterium]|jgi:hypothetical protein